MAASPKDMNGLTKQHRAFCDAYVYLTDFDKLKALEMAGYEFNLEHNAVMYAKKLLTKPPIQRYIQNLLEEKQRVTAVDRTVVIEKLKEFAFDENRTDNTRLRALELLGKHLDLFTDKHVIEKNSDGNSISKSMFGDRIKRIESMKEQVGKTVLELNSGEERQEVSDEQQSTELVGESDRS